jgi:hypothetical protein
MSSPQQPQQAASQSHITPPPPTAASASTSAPAPAAPAPTQNAPTADASPAPESFNDKLNAAERYWKFKIAGYTICLIVGLIGVGCFGWATSTSLSDHTEFSYNYDTSWSMPWPLITFSISVVWSFIVAAVTLLRKRPVHPGLRVSMDLLLWLGYIGTVMLALYSFISIRDWGRYGSIDSFYYSSSSDGQYELASNGTWIWDQPSSSSSLYSSTTYPRDCTRPSRYSYYDAAPFASCAEQDAYVNKMWADKPHRMDVVLTGVVCQFINLILHFALFVWACVDTSQRNRTKVSKDAEKIAAGIVEKMIQNGALIRPPPQSYAPPQQYAYPQQGYQMPMQQQQYMYPQMQQQQQQQGAMFPAHAPAPAPAPAPAAAGPSTEKSVGPRYA